MFELTGKTAVITGGGSGIGRAIAMLFARRGASVHILDIGADAGAQVLREIAEEGGRAVAQTCDVTQQTQVRACFAAIGPIDILINNAGVAHVGKADNTDEADFDRVIGVNVKGAYNCLHAAIPLLKDCLLYTSPSPRDRQKSRMPSSA